MLILIELHEEWNKIMGKKVEVYYELCEFVEDELKEMTKKLRKTGGQMSATDLEYLNKLTETANNIDTKINRAESKEGY